MAPINCYTTSNPPAVDAAESINYQATKAHVASPRKREVDTLDARLASDEIDLKRYTLEKRQVDEKYSYNL